MLFTSTGYNQWGGAFRESVPWRIRYPRIMLGAAAWPYQWRVDQFFRDANYPATFMQRGFAEFHASTANGITWAILPTIPGGLSLTFLFAELLGTKDAPTGIRYHLSFLQQIGQKYKSGPVTIEYPQPLEFGTTPQNQSFEMHVVADPPLIHNSASYRFRTPLACGEQWEIF
jgi:hypothetical protein